MKNYSKQREEIIKILKNSFNHPTAEEVYIIAKTNDPSVSRSTVYRNLGLLVEDETIIKIPMLVGADRYDYKKEPHNHIICTKCGKVFDFKYNFELDSLKNKIKCETGVEISVDGIAIQGICDNCK